MIFKAYIVLIYFLFLPILVCFVLFCFALFCLSKKWDNILSIFKAALVTLGYQLKSPQIFISIMKVLN